MNRYSLHLQYHQLELHRTQIRRKSKRLLPLRPRRLNTQGKSRGRVSPFLSYINLHSFQKKLKSFFLFLLYFNDTPDTTWNSTTILTFSDDTDTTILLSHFNSILHSPISSTTYTNKILKIIPKKTSYIPHYLNLYQEMMIVSIMFSNTSALIFKSQTEFIEPHSKTHISISKAKTVHIIYSPHYLVNIFVE